MKFFEKMMALLLSLAAVLSFAMPAFAEDTTTAPEGRHTITIRFEKPDHEYKAYQVFKGDYSKDKNGDGHLSTISWGSGVDGETLLAALKDDTNAGLATDFENANTAEEVADILAGYQDDSAKLDAFAKLVEAHLTNVVAGTSTQSTAKDAAGQYVYTISVTGDGYYFVKDSKELLTNANDANTKYILQVLNDVEIHAKADVPDIDKKITGVDGTDQGKQGSYNVGDTIYFALTSKVPAMDGYTSYTYKVTDTLSSGLTLVQENGKPKVEVTIYGTAYKDFTATLNNNNVLTIVFTDFIGQKANAGRDIVIRYSAVLNENALQKDKETNTVNLEYSNDPNTSGTGKTTDKKTYVYNFDIDIVKVDQNDNTKQLNGAEFVLYHEDAQGKKEYYHYTADKKTEWVPLTDDKLETVTAAVNADQITKKTTVNGQTSFTGLKAGTYYLLEIKAPDGYSLPTAPVKVVITAAYDANGVIDKDKSNVQVKTNGHLYIEEKITNKPGPILPSTGGIGTTIFYVLGGILTVAAIVLLIVKKRMENTKR